jgi:drug/metabolite transporter (DMT)-like permease
VTLAAALTGAIMVSFSAILFALADVDPVTGGFYRAAYALPVLLVIWLVRRNQDQRPPNRRWLAFGAGIALGLDVVLWHTSINFIGTGLATLLANSQVIIVAIAAWLLQGEEPSRRVLVAIPIVLVGVTLVSGLGQGGAFGENPLLGAGLALAAAVFYAAFLLGFRASNVEKAPPAGPLLEATAGAVLASLAVGLLGGGIAFAPTWPSHGWLLALALGAQVVAWMLIGYALPRLPAVETATIILVQPALTMIWGSLIFTERPSPLQMAGAALVLIGVGMVAVSRARSPVQPAESPA